MVKAGICRWYGGKRAALSLRFDDSHPTHVENAVPILNEYGLVGTFMINPGRENHKNFRAAWEGSILEQGHELANHTVNHRGAMTDRVAEAEIGGCSEYIRGVQEDESPVLAFARGGGTTWMPRKPARFFLEKYALFRTGNSMSCSEVYEHFSVDRFRERLDRALEQGEWLQTHFHCIGDGYLNIAIPTFRKLLAYAQNDGVWSAGMREIHKYQEARDGAMVLAHVAGDDAVVMTLTCTTAPELYNYPLTLEVGVPEGITDVTVVGADGQAVAHQIVDETGGRVVRFDVAPVDGVYTVRGAGLGAQYLAAHGTDLPDPGPHPYVFFKQADVPGLLAKAEQPFAGEMWDRVKQQADRIVASDPPEVPAGGTSVEDARRASGHLRVLGLVYALTWDAAFATRAAGEVEVILAADSWNHPQHRGDADLVSAEITCSLGLAYDWLHAGLSADLKDRMREAMVTRGLGPIARATDEGEWWTHWYRGNWGSVIYGQAGVAALSLLGDDPRAADWVRLCWRKIWGYGQALGTDGSWGESVSYACYAWSNATLLMDAMHRMTDGRLDLFDNPRLRRLPEWFIHMLTPDELEFVPFSNCGKGTRFRGQYLYRLARAYGDGHAQWIGQRMAADWGGADVFGFLWCDPGLAPVPPVDLPTANVFTHTDWAAVRSGWEDPEATLFALKGGQKDWDHYHHDMNHFVLYAYGRPLIVDLFYPHKIWGCETEAHNTVVVNEKDQRGVVRLQGCRGKPDHRGVVGDLVDTPWYARLVGDASLAYEPADVNSFVREVLYLRRGETDDSPEYFILFDDVDATGAVPMDWHLHTFGKMEMAGNRVTVVQDDAAADVTVVSPQAFTHGIHRKGIEEATGSPLPFEGATHLTFLKLRPKENTDRGCFLSVIVPRRAFEDAQGEVSAIEGENVRGVQVVNGPVVDRALFVLEDPEADVAGVRLTGRTCFVRRTGDRVTGAALHNGQRLVADGVLLFETDGFGHAVLMVGPDAVTATLDVMQAQTIRIHAPERPTRVRVDGRERAFVYEAESRCVQLDAVRGMEEVRIER